ncbi:TniQ family protein [Aestuariicella sp. G3-2]|uniref:TniQ family protein n=1 Tax=Pseudomaricurvus albidus TaxID=2842452 RepID=UPI001C0C7840|nr:TniQ family protein [Aestuariicella albida]MBU3068264.1 TniQ family protein [Aestuariicella albida]
MILNVDLVPKLATVDIEINESQYPFFLPLIPYGNYTGDVECMSSYLCRQAEECMMLSHPYSRKLIEKYVLPSHAAKTNKLASMGYHACNGFGVMAGRYIEAITTATNNSIDGRYLTVKPLEYLSSKCSRGFLLDHISWCNECWKEDVASGRTPYTRLYWLFSLSKVCTLHHSRLKKSCSRCGALKPVYAPFPRQWICDSCGHSLIEETPEKGSTEASPKDLWLTHSIYKLIERVWSEKTLLNSNQAKISILRLLESFSMTLQTFCERLNINPITISRFVDGGGRPYFPTLIDICYKLDIPLDNFLFDSDNLTAPENWRSSPCPHFYKSPKITEFRKKKIKESLNNVLTENPYPPINVSSLSCLHHISYNQLNYHFPEEYRMLRERYTAWEIEQREHRRSERLDNLTRSVLSLVKKDTYPSDRKLRDLKLVPASDLRRDDVKSLLRSLQKKYANLEQSNRNCF